MRLLAKDHGVHENARVWAQIYEEHYARVFRTAFRVTGNIADAEDVLQTIFLRLIRKEREPEIDNLESYLYRAAMNASLDLISSRRRWDAISLDEAAPRAPGDSGETAELRQWLRIALSELSARPAMMFLLRYVEGYDNGEIARLLNTSKAVVAVTLHHTRRQLQRRFRVHKRDGV